MIFVLGVMMFLMSIGVSTLAAAYANAGYIMRQSDFARVRLLHESIHENIMYSLQADPEDEDLLGFQLARAIFRANDPLDAAYAQFTPDPTLENPYPDPIATGLLPITDLTILIDGAQIAVPGGRITVENITLSFPEQFVNINDAIPAVPQFPPPPASGADIITPAEPREPRTATLNASMVVEVEISSGNRTITSIAVFEYIGGRLTDNPTGVPTFINPTNPPPMQFVPSVPGTPPIEPEDPEDPEDTGTPGTPGYSGGYGIWRMVRHEVIDR